MTTWFVRLNPAPSEEEARRLGKKAEDDGDLRTAMTAIRESVRIVELPAKIQTEVKEAGGTAVHVIYVIAPGKSEKPAIQTDSSRIVDLPPVTCLS
jgi:hypothetical protein